MEFARQEHEWVAIPVSRSSQRGFKSTSPVLQAESLLSEPLGKPMGILALPKAQKQDARPCMNGMVLTLYRPWV